MAGCASVLDATIPHSGYRLVENQAYGPGPRRGIDVYVPDPAPSGRAVPQASVAEAPAPMIVFLYGGAWRDGDKSLYRFVGQAFASRGFVMAIPNYRLYPEVTYPDFLVDGAQAIAWARQHAAEFGADPKRLYVMGHSAGAYNAIMLAVNRTYLAAYGIDTARDIRGAIGLAGPYDFLPYDETTGPVFGNAPDPRSTQPVDVTDGRGPPLFLGQGTDDSTVKPRNAVRLGEVYTARGGSATVKLYPDTGHIKLVAALAAPLHFLAPVLDDTLRFIEEHP